MAESGRVGLNPMDTNQHWARRCHPSMPGLRSQGKMIENDRATKAEAAVSRPPHSYVSVEVVHQSTSQLSQPISDLKFRQRQVRYFV